MVRTVGIVANPRPEAIELAGRLRDWLGDRGHEVSFSEGAAESLEGARCVDAAQLREVDLLLALGGDGTLIHAAHLLEGARVPIFGINVGYLGFLTDTAGDEDLHGLLEGALEERAPVEERMMLQVELHRGGETLFEGLVLNDAVVAKAALARIAELRCTVDGKRVADYRVDGLIVSTPTGSTAYNLSAGGPIVYPTLRAIVVSPICPHTLSQRPLVMPSEADVHLRLESDNGEMFLTLDGQSGHAMEQGDEVVARASSSRVYLVRNPRFDFFELLRRKLKWG